MEPAKDIQTNDEFGYQRFALTELAYDLINSLTGIYARLLLAEEKRTKPDTEAVAVWDNRIDQLQDLVHTKDWSDLAFLDQLIRDLSAEYKASSSLEVSLTTNNVQPDPRPVSAF